MIGASEHQRREAMNAINRQIHMGSGLLRTQEPNITRLFSSPDVHPFDEVAWELRTADISDEAGQTRGEQPDVEVPARWSQLATNVLASKYFHGALDAADRERSVKQIISRVTDTLSAWGKQDGYFLTDDEARAFHAELTSLLLHQRAVLSGPIWSSVGVEPEPLCSTSVILSVDDTMESILEWYRTDGLMCKRGAGSGVNLSAIRSASERLSGGGQATGPVSFLRAADASSGAIRPGGRMRRISKLVALNDTHPDFTSFVRSKWDESEKIRALFDAGYDVLSHEEMSAFAQQATRAVRLSDRFMHCVMNDEEWELCEVTTGEVRERVKARDALRLIADAAWHCGDPIVQFDTRANDWHTCPHSGRINASSSGGEYLHVDNSSCQSGSLNLLAFVDEEGRFLIEAFKHAVRIMMTALDIVLEHSSYPTPDIDSTTKTFRCLALGYDNLGALLMSLGIPYDSDEARAYAACLSALLTGQAYVASAELAERLRPFLGYAVNRDPMLQVLKLHREAVDRIQRDDVSETLCTASADVWDEALLRGARFGFRNAQVTAVSSSGSTAFLMDCESIGLEPCVSLVTYQKQVGGGLLKHVSPSVQQALARCGYDTLQIQAMLDHLEEHETIEDAPGLRREHAPIFDCLMKPRRGVRQVHLMGQMRMVASVQPFISGGVPKTLRLSPDMPVEDVVQLLIAAWQLGLKSLAAQRDGGRERNEERRQQGSGRPESRGRKHERHALPDERRSITHRFAVDGHEGHVTVGMYEDGKPGELAVSLVKGDAVVNGLLEAFAKAVSLALQYDVPLPVLIRTFSLTQFPPAGKTSNPDIRAASSLVDYVMQWLSLKFLTEEERAAFEEETAAEAAGGSREAELLLARQLFGHEVDELFT